MIETRYEEKDGKIFEIVEAREANEAIYSRRLIREVSRKEVPYIPNSIEARVAILEERIEELERLIKE